ncbi:MAG TPA: Rieske (2Fe-2S) protein [Kofleriaceae bacterium]|nr:Rieske (2Fe-2S) protein [Kofleriaceae bacterium]
MATLVTIGACKADDDNPGVDGGTTPDGAPVDPGFEVCGGNICIDLSKEVNASLNTVGGSKVFTITTPVNDKIIVVKTADTTFATVSAVCTHQRCTVRLSSVTTGYVCPCHGSKYTIDGMVTQGPAVVALKQYTNSLSGTTLTITPA